MTSPDIATNGRWFHFIRQHKRNYRLQTGEQQIMNDFIFNLSRIQSEAKLLFLRETIKSVLAISDNMHVRAQIFNFWLNFSSFKEI